MNSEIWDKLANQAKRRDLHVADIQKAVTKVGAILTRLASKIIATLADSKNSNITSILEELQAFSTGAIALLAHSDQSLFQHRCDLIRPCLDKAYSAMCSAHIPISRKLFEDELQSQLNSIKASIKISNLAASASSRCFHDKPGNNNKSGMPFLARGGRKSITARKNSGRKEAVTKCSLRDLLGQVDIDSFVSLIPTLTHFFTL